MSDSHRSSDVTGLHTGVDNPSGVVRLMTLVIISIVPSRSLSTRQ
jgi:hypothetical protein